jgi:hypothetical protein
VEVWEMNFWTFTSPQEAEGAIANRKKDRTAKKRAEKPRNKPQRPFVQHWQHPPYWLQHSLLGQQGEAQGPFEGLIHTFLMILVTW